MKHSNLLNNALSIHNDASKSQKELPIHPIISDNTDSDKALFEKLRRPLPTSDDTKYLGIKSVENYNPNDEHKDDKKHNTIPYAPINITDNVTDGKAYDLEEPVHKISPKKNSNKFIYYLLGSVFLLIIFLFIIILSYVYQSQSAPNNFPSNHLNNENIGIIAEKNISNIQKILNEAAILENKNDIMAALKKRLSVVNSYIKLKEYQVALEEAKVISDIIEKKLPDMNDPTLKYIEIYHYNFLSEIFYHLNNMEKAVSHSRHALKISLEFQQDTPLSIIKQYHLLAFNLDNIGDFEQALKMRYNAVTITLGIDKTLIDEGQLISEMNNLGQEYRALERLQESETILMLAIKRIENNFSIDAPELIIVLNNLGLTQQENDNRTIALAYLQQAHTLAYRHYGSDHTLTKTISKNIKRFRSIL